MNLPFSTIRELNKFIDELDNSNLTLPRHLAIREAARFFICLVNEELYDECDASAKHYKKIIDTLCRL